MDMYILLCTALELKNIEVAKLLVASCSEDIEDSTNPNSPLHFAILNNDTEIIKMLLDEPPNQNVENFNGITALHNAVERIKAEILYAVNGSSKESTSFLSSERASVDDNGDDAVTSCDIATDPGEHSSPLHLAADKGNEEIIKLSVSKGADVSAKDKSGRTAIHIATAKGHSKTVELLLKHGADANSVQTCKFAGEEGNKDDGITCLDIATEKWDSQTIEILLNGGADTAYTNKIGYTLLHLAAQFQDEQITELCLSKGADVNARNRYGETPLHIATKKGHAKMVELLLKRGAEINSACTDLFWNFTPLHIAVENGYDDIIKLLLDNGAECKR